MLGGGCWVVAVGWWLLTGDRGGRGWSWAVVGGRGWWQRWVCGWWLMVGGWLWVMGDG